ncbi:MAG: hypothetical protein IKO47_00755 [Ruminococcus sp.]|nr:hypothetical protein [Ruminococcus sp.]
MAFCRYCGKQIEDGKVCADCAAKNNEAPAENVQPQFIPENVQPQPTAELVPPAVAPQPMAAAYPTQPAVKRNINKGIVALLSLFGVFSVFTIVILAVFG